MGIRCEGYPIRDYGYYYCGMPDCLVRRMVQGAVGDHEFCMLYAGSSWSQEETNAGNDDDSQDYLLHLVDRAVSLTVISTLMAK